MSDDFLFSYQPLISIKQYISRFISQDIEKRFLPYWLQRKVCFILICCTDTEDKIPYLI